MLSEWRSIGLKLMIDESNKSQYQHVFALLSSREFMHALYMALSRPEGLLLQHIIFYYSDQLFTLRQLEKSFSEIEGDSVIRLIGLTGLRRKGLLYTLRRPWGEEAFFIPGQLEEPIYRMVLQNQGEDRIEPCEEPVEPFEWETPPLFVDAMSMLDKLAQQVYGMTQLNQNGTIQKRVIRQIEQSWQDRENIWEVLYEHRESYKPQTAILLDYFTRYGVLQWTSQQVRLNRESAQLFFSCTKQQWLSSFLSYWLSIARFPHPWLARYAKDIVYCEENDTWFYVLDIIQQWEAHYSLPKITEVLQLAEEKVLKPLQVCGFIELGKTASGARVWRKKSYIEERHYWLQPNLELYAPQTLQLSALWHLLTLFDWQGWEQMLIFTLAESKVKRLLQEGFNISKWIEELRALSMDEIPDFLQLRLQDLKEAQHVIRAEEMTLIYLHDEPMVVWFMKEAEERDWHCIQVMKENVLIAREYAKEALQLLSDKGYAVSQEQQEETLESDVEAVQLIQQPSSLELNKLESIFPDWHEAVPAWKQLPQLWKQQFQGYHHRTKLDMIKTAMNHYLDLKIEMNGQTHIIQPDALKDQGGQWVCHSRDNQLYLVQKLDKLQLLFPFSKRA